MSLRDQLLQAGVATKKQHQQARTQKKKQDKNKTKKNTVSTNTESNTIKQAKQEQKLRDKELNQKKESERATKALQAQIKQMITTNEIKRDTGDLPYRFTHNKRVKTLYLNQEQSQQVIKGNISIATIIEGTYYLVPWLIAEKIEERSPESIIVNNRKASKNIETEKEAPYAEYEIPDDLMW